ncbi:hypothetical protein [Sphingobacterium faecium]|uniref:hypothetical protein n=1 Tax=Sphingobacterium faecium TaxID=34087 RepID=UPI0024694C23|nr:hypothetical protein [Sphingobacterium faecium]MDH5828832.1 hypothetical protein [Sphingobacterium faecium]WGQ17029.1 hypothetical protein QG727_22910 [Sphingobacterium faecium]
MKRMYKNEMGLATDGLLPNYAISIFQERINTTLVILEKKFNLNVFDQDSYLFTIIADNKIDIKDYMFVNNINKLEDYTL